MNPYVVIILGISTLLMWLIINKGERIIHRKDEELEKKTKGHVTEHPAVVQPTIYYVLPPDIMQNEEDRRSSSCLLLLIIALIALIMVLIYFKINYLS